MTPETTKPSLTAGPLTFKVKHELWDGNVQDHPDQGVTIEVAADVDGKQTNLLRFHCFDTERSYIYGPENSELVLEGPMMLNLRTRGTKTTGQLYRMDPTTDGNPIGWTVRTLEKKLPQMLVRAGYPSIAEKVDMDEVTRVLPEVEAHARHLYAAKRNTVKHNRGTHIFPVSSIKFGLEMRRLPVGDGGLAIHVLADLAGNTEASYVEETEILAFDLFWDGAHYHYGPRNKNHRIYWDKTLVDDPFEWVFHQFETRKLKAMIERAGYPGVAADLDEEKVAAMLPTVKKTARELIEKGLAATGKPGLPAEPTPNLVPR